MFEKIVVIWIIMIVGYVLNGVFYEVLEFFIKMIDLDYKLNYIMFLVVF